MRLALGFDLRIGAGDANDLLHFAPTRSNRQKNPLY
jgi:hypothetical protein